MRDMAGGLEEIEILERELMRGLAIIKEEYISLVREEQALLNKINEALKRASPIKGSLVYKWVKNKVGNRYWYWYLHVKDGNRTRSIYLGKQIPPEYIQGIETRRVVRNLESRLRTVVKRKLELEKKLREAIQALY